MIHISQLDTKGGVGSNIRTLFSKIRKIEPMKNLPALFLKMRGEDGKVFSSRFSTEKLECFMIYRGSQVFLYSDIEGQGNPDLNHSELMALKTHPHHLDKKCGVSPTPISKITNKVMEKTEGVSLEIDILPRQERLSHDFVLEFPKTHFPSLFEKGGKVGENFSKTEEETRWGAIFLYKRAVLIYQKTEIGPFPISHYVSGDDFKKYKKILLGISDSLNPAP